MKRKRDSTTHVTVLTGEQIKLIRSLQLRMDMLYIHPIAAVFLNESGDVERKPLWECHFCRKGSYESAADVSHAKDCIFTLAETEFSGLNAQFLKAESESAQ